MALACAKALTDSVWRRVGFVPRPAGNSLGGIALSGSDHLGMIGYFPPLIRQVRELDRQLTALEPDEAMVLRQGQRFPDVNISLDRSRLASCNVVVGTSTMLLNHTLDAMLAAAPQATYFAMIGPSAELWPDTGRTRCHVDGGHTYRRWTGISRGHRRRHIMECLCTEIRNPRDARAWLADAFDRSMRADPSCQPCETDTGA